MKQTIRRGFTIVELLIVIVVIGILASITLVAYTNIQKQARDTRVRDAADKVADAMQIFVAKNGHVPRGGDDSTSDIEDLTECPAEGDLYGVSFFATDVYPCTVEDTLKASGYLPKDFAKDLPQNTLYSSPTDPENLSLMVSSEGSGDVATGGVVYFTQEESNAKMDAHFESETTKCGVSSTRKQFVRDHGMRDAICIPL
jgi:prepilin-type N-terminal cleavage/methylation domain-containing protein